MIRSYQLVSVCQCSTPVAGAAQAVEHHHLIPCPDSRFRPERLSYECLIGPKKSSGDVLYLYWLYLSQECKVQSVNKSWKEQDALGFLYSQM
jgi:hypothetical protein